MRKDIPSKRINVKLIDSYFEGFFIEIYLRSKKWLLHCSYNAKKKK